MPIKSMLQQTSLYYLYKKAKGEIACVFYQQPSKDMFIIGVTGTDGKSTTSIMIHHFINKVWGKAALVSGVFLKIGNETVNNTTKMTSFDPWVLQEFIRKAKSQGCKYLVLEVASHGIDQHRFTGINFDAAVLTNITSDHLDRHKTHEHYVATKKKLFQRVASQNKKTSHAVFPKDDKYGKKRYKEIGYDKSIDYGIHGSASCKADNIVEHVDKTTCTISYLGQKHDISLPLVGMFNVQNLLAAVSTAVIIGIPLPDIIPHIETIEGIPGRMQRKVISDRIIYIDYAHTVNGLENVLTFLDHVKEKKRIIHVVGAPGERDRSKRKEMGQLASTYSDIVILTDDDPGYEDRYTILNDVYEGINKTLAKDLFIMPQRKHAVQLAWDISQPGDIIIFTGKGHETVQHTNFGKRQYNDFLELSTYINEQNKHHEHIEASEKTTVTENSTATA